MLAAIAGILAASAGARADDCATVMTAIFAQAKLPYASSGVMAMPGQPPRSTEVVVTGAKMYVQVNGAWQSQPYSAQEVIDRATENAKKTKSTCQKIGAEAVNGEAATVYADHEETPRGVVDNRIWISDSRGLPLKIEVKLGSGTTTTQTTRYDDIQPPAGAK
jgi:outer membrane lipoprotein-sorting protein